MIDRLEAQGSWKLDLPLSNLMNAEWGRAVVMRMGYLKQAKDVKLEDLVERS